MGAHRRLRHPLLPRYQPPPRRQRGPGDRGRAGRFRLSRRAARCDCGVRCHHRPMPRKRGAVGGRVAAAATVLVLAACSSSRPVGARRTEHQHAPVAGHVHRAGAGGRPHRSCPTRGGADHRRLRCVPILTGFVNSAPPRFTTNGRACGGDLKPGMEAEYARYLAAVVRTLHDRDHITIRYVSPMNEPDNSFGDCGQEGMRVPVSQRAAVVQALGRELAQHRSVSTCPTGSSTPRLQS